MNWFNLNFRRILVAGFLFFGFISAGFSQSGIPQGRCTAVRLNVRSEPELNSVQVGFLEKDEEVEILSRQNRKEEINGLEDYWLEIRNSRLQGWVFGGYMDYPLESVEINSPGSFKEIQTTQRIHFPKSGVGWQTLGFLEEKGNLKIDIPQDWRFNGVSVFYDSQENKTAELFPGFLRTEEGERYYIDSRIISENFDFRAELVLLEEYLGHPDYDGQISVISMRDLDWDMVSFFLYKGNLCFGIRFYTSYGNYKSELDFFKQIVDSIEFNTQG